MNDLINDVTIEYEKLKKKLAEEQLVNSELKNFLHLAQTTALCIHDNIDYHLLGKTVLKLILTETEEKERPYSEIKQEAKFIDDFFLNLSVRNIDDIIEILHSTDSDKSMIDPNDNSKDSLNAKFNRCLRKTSYTTTEIMEFFKDYSFNTLLGSFITIKIYKELEAVRQSDESYVKYSSAAFAVKEMTNTAGVKGARKVIKKTQESIKKCNKKIVAYEELLNFLNESKEKNEITKIIKEHKKLPEEIEYKFLKEIYLHNMKYYDQLMLKYEQLSKDSIVGKKQLLQEYGVSEHNNINLAISINELKKYLAKLKELDLINHKELGTIISNSNEEKLSKIIDKVKSGYLNRDFLKKNINLLFDSNNDYGIIEENINTLSRYKVPKEVIHKYNKILLTNQELIKNNCISIEKYGYTNSLQNTYSLKFITSDDLVKKMDILIELGYSKNIEEDLILLKYDINRYKRLKVLSTLNYNLEKTDAINSLLKADSFIIPDEYLDNYIQDMGKYINIETDELSKDEFIDRLELNNSSDDSRYYNFYDMIISKEKVKRELKNTEKEKLTGNEQLAILTKNKNLNIDEVQVLKSLLTNKENNKVIKKIKN